MCASGVSDRRYYFYFSSTAIEAMSMTEVEID